MIETILDVISWIALSLGGFFYLVGGIGLLRMPDVFTRMHAVSVTETLGVALLILGMVLQAGFTLIAAKLIIIFLVLMVTAPVSSHAVARAALHDGQEPLLADGTGKLSPRRVTDLFPTLARRLEEPATSEAVEADATEGGKALPAETGR